MTKKAKRSKKKKRLSDSAIKGRLVELIVASMHNAPDLKVEQNVFLPAIESSSNRTREIDVLITQIVEGYKVQIAVECKNYSSKIDVPFIDAFLGKLYDVGIPTQRGVFVSVNGFTDGALERASKDGITPLVLTGLTEDRLAANIEQAIQSVIYLLPTVTNITVACDAPEYPNLFQTWFLYDKDGAISCTIPDLVWKRWLEGFPPSRIGEYDSILELPGERFIRVGKQSYLVYSISVKIQITGLLLVFSGRVHQHHLINPIQEQIDKFVTNATFDVSPKQYPIIHFDTEDQLKKYIKNRTESFKLTMGRIRLPRVKAYSLYWPLSKRAANELFKSFPAIQQGVSSPLNEEDLAMIESNDMKALWDPIWKENPILKELSSAGVQL